MGLHSHPIFHCFLMMGTTAVEFIWTCLELWCEKDLFWRLMISSHRVLAISFIRLGDNVSCFLFAWKENYTSKMVLDADRAPWTKDLLQASGIHRRLTCLPTFLLPRWHETHSLLWRLHKRNRNWSQMYAWARGKCCPLHALKVRQCIPNALAQLAWVQILSVHQK